MKLKAMTVAGIVAAVLLGNACATKKYVRNRVNERATPLESRTGAVTSKTFARKPTALNNKPTAPPRPPNKLTRA